MDDIKGHFQTMKAWYDDRDSSIWRYINDAEAQEFKSIAGNVIYYLSQYNHHKHFYSPENLELVKGNAKYHATEYAKKLEPHAILDDLRMVNVNKPFGHLPSDMIEKARKTMDDVTKEAVDNGSCVYQASRGPLVYDNKGVINLQERHSSTLEKFSWTTADAHAFILEKFGWATTDDVHAFAIRVAEDHVPHTDENAELIKVFDEGYGIYD